MTFPPKAWFDGGEGATTAEMHRTREVGWAVRESLDYSPMPWLYRAVVKTIWGVK
jgi:hypothetical protein